MYMSKNGGRAWRQMGDDQVSTVPPGGIDSAVPGPAQDWFQTVIDAMAAFPDANVTDPTDTGTSSTVTSSDFNCTKYAGICKPMTLKTLGIVQAAQGQLNRVASQKGFALIQVDGGIGPDTLRLFNQCAAVGGWVPMPSVVNLAQDIENVASEANTLANSLGAPAAVAPPAATSPATFVNKNGVEKKAPAANQQAANTGIIAAFTGLSTLAQAAAVGIVGVGLFYLSKKNRRKGR